MARINTLQPIVRSVQGRVSRADKVHFKKLYGETYAVRVDNPYRGPRTEPQKQATDRFTAIQAQALNLATANPEKYAELSRKFKSQRTYKTLRGYIFAKLYSEALAAEEDDNNGQNGNG